MKEKHQEHGVEIIGIWIYETFVNLYESLHVPYVCQIDVQPKLVPSVGSSYPVVRMVINHCSSLVFHKNNDELF